MIDNVQFGDVDFHNEVKILVFQRGKDIGFRLENAFIGEASNIAISVTDAISLCETLKLIIKDIESKR